MIPVVLLPGLDRVLTRNAERSGNRRLSDDEVARIHGRMAGWRTSGLPIIDNSNLSVPETAAALDRAVMSRPAGALRSRRGAGGARGSRRPGCGQSSVK